MKFTRIFTGPDHQSHFKEEIFEMNDNFIGKITNTLSVETLYFGEITDDTEVGWHNPPIAQFVIMLEGSMEIEIGDGTRKIFHPGDIVLAEDINGQGHNTRPASKGKLRYMVVTMPV